jgi:cation/acetate symporter
VKVINPEASPKRQLLYARLGTILMAIIVTLIALKNFALIGQLVAVAFSLAGCTIFPLFLLGIWWSDSNKSGAIAGLITGGTISVIAITYFIAGKSGVILPAHEFISYWLEAWYFAWIGAPLAILANIIVSKLTKETPLEIRKFLIEKVHT